jgi:N-acetylmuramoyl-L-alanine amidase
MVLADIIASWNVCLLALCNWRESRGCSLEARTGQACSIRNRVRRPRWWGKDFLGVITCPMQYSSFNVGDPNATKFPPSVDQAWPECLTIADAVYHDTIADTVQGATHYYDSSLDARPPKWALDGTSVHVVNIDRLRFWRAF